jgi:phosphoribosylformylglycinamidine synthase
MAIGERTPLAIIDPAASGRMAIAEALTNLAAARIRKLDEIKLSANWMAAAGHSGDDAALFDTVRAVGMELCQALGVAIPVGKDSMSMKTVWSDENGERNEVTAPVSLIVSAFAPVSDVRATLTPVLTNSNEPTELLLIDLGAGKNRMGGCVLAQVYKQLGNACPDVDDARQLRRLLLAIQALNEAGLLLAYHDRSDGGLWTTLCEMAFAGRVGLQIKLDGLAGDPVAILFNEELGIVCQTRVKDHTRVRGILAEFGLDELCHIVGEPIAEPMIRVEHNGEKLYEGPRVDLHRAWSETTWRLQSMRDHPVCAQQEYDRIGDVADPGLHAELTFDAHEDICRPFVHAGQGPRVAILREQGVNGHIEMAAAFHIAGFTTVDVTMSDLIGGAVSLDHFQGLVACGGFSFGDVLGAGEGWAKSVLFNSALRDQFQGFFHRTDTFTLGVCNGCQMLSNLHELIPGTDHWPRFVRNQSEQFEARWVMVEVMDSPSVLLTQMQGSRIPVVVAHGEGRAEFTSTVQQSRVAGDGLVALRFVDHRGEAAETYPYNPNGSPAGVTGLTSADGRANIMMPHPERVFRSVSNTWTQALNGEYGPWMRLFRNARVWVG